MSKDRSPGDRLYYALFPELRRFPDLRAGRRLMWDHWHNHYGILWVLGLTYIGAGFLIVFRGRLGDGIVLVAYALIPIAVFAALWVFRKAIRQDLRRRLNAMGIAVCLRCGYDLQGLSEPRCPECGTRFEESLLK